MRENMGLYRGKRIKDGEWVEGNLFVDDKGEKCEILVGYTNYRIAYEVALETVGQWTGLVDKNGKKIFEGDILNTSNSNCRIWYVDYKKAAFCANQGNVNYACELSEFMDTVAVEVIGNIHDEKEVEG